jgi:hypothetical protein
VLKVAVADLLASAVTVQVADVPLQAPVQPAKAEPLLGVAVRVIVDPKVKLAAQTEPHTMPAGLLVTGPLPVPDLKTVNAALAGPDLKTAEALVACDMKTVHVGDDPVQAPDQLSKCELAQGTAVSVTVVPHPKLAEQVEPQSSPEGVDRMLPGPLLETDNG